MWRPKPVIRDAKCSLLHENRVTEFKMHTTVSIDELPHHCEMIDKGKVVRTRQPLSKTICAFLNTAGGKIYVGIDDKGFFRGTLMNGMLLDHLLLSLDATMKRFNPRPADGAITVEIFPVVPATGRFSDDELRNMEILPYPEQTVHILHGSCKPCRDALHLGASTVIVLIHVKKLDDCIYSNEEGLTYERTHGGNRLLTVDKLRQRLQARLGDEGFGAIDQALAYKGDQLKIVA
ncbi:unnamed protein product, partial [Mesorhabditis spiculigera]